jgi:uncharacterized protein
MMTAASCAVVTGASSGIGECFARALAQRKQNLFLIARSAGKLQQLARELHGSAGIQAELFASDLSEPGAAARVAQELRDRQIQTSLLINNAGFGARGEFWRLPLDQQMQMIRLHLDALVELTQALLPSMIERRRGAVINVSSVTSFQPIPYAAIYAATKAFMTSFSMGLAEELRPYGIPVVTLCPGGTRTNFVTVGAQKGRGKFPGGPQSPEDVVRDALDKLDAGGLVVPKFANKLTVFVQRLMPRSLVPRAVATMSRPRS